MSKRFWLTASIAGLLVGLPVALVYGLVREAETKSPVP